MAMKAAEILKKKGDSKKKAKPNALIDWIGKRRNSSKKWSSKAKEDKNSEQDEEE